MALSSPPACLANYYLFSRAQLVGHSLLEDFPDPQCWLRLSALSYHLPPWSTLSPCLPLPRDRVLLGNRVCVLVTSTNSVPNRTAVILFTLLSCIYFVPDGWSKIKHQDFMPLSLCIKGEPGGLLCWGVLANTSGWRLCNGEERKGQTGQGEGWRGEQTAIWGSAPTWGCSWGWLPDTAVPSTGLKVCVQNTQSVALVSKGTNPSRSRNTSYPVFDSEFFFFPNNESKGLYSSTWSHFPNLKFRIQSPVIGVLWRL